MNIIFNRYNEPIQGHVYLGTPNGKILCAINGIEESTFKLTSKFNNTFELTFDLNENILIQDGKGLSKLVHSNVYDLVGWLMRVYVENVGWFIMEHPKITDDGMKQIKTITCQSAEIEMQQHDLKNFKINQGTTDSYEMLADNNVEKIDDVEFAKEQIKFHNPQNPQLSLIDLALKAAGMKGWSVGEIDSTPKTYRTYKDGKYVETTTLLSNEIGAFDVESQDLYSFFTQDMAKYFQCVFVFDFLHMKISAYHPENYGKSTNVNINFRNLQQSQEITVDDSTLFTRYYVQGADDLGITYVNFGSNYIENIDYYLNEKYFSPLLIIKYKLWKEDYEEARILYIEATRQYNEQMKVVTELYDRVPLDDCSTDWSTFTDDELKEAQANYQAQLKGYEQFYVDDDGNFDENALKNSSDANDYYQIKNVILPSIQIEMDNRQLPTDDDNADYVDSYKTNWKLYGLDELKVKLQEYKNTIETCKKGGYDQPYTEDSSHTKDVHDTMYAKYLDAQNQLDSNYVGGCQEAYDQRQSEIDAANEILNSYNKTRTDLVKQISKETWSGVVAADNSGYILDEAGNYITDEAGRRIYCDTQKLQFTERDLTELSKVYYDGDYSNENMFLTDSDDQVSAIDEQLKLLDAAIDDLYIASHPQYQFTTSLDNFLALADYEDYIKNINQGDYLWLTVDNKVVKLRVVEIQYNPLIADNSIQITFSNMIQGRSSRNDLSYVLNTPSNASKSSASGSSNNFLNNEGITLTAGLIQKLISNGAFKNGVSQIINNEFAGMLAGGSISLEELNAKIIKVTDLYGKNGYFEYLQAKLITAGRVVADSADFKELSALAATIKSAIIGASSTETGIVINLTTENATMSEAMIKDLIAKYITVNELKAGDIYTNKIKILSENGTLRIQDNTFSIYDEDGNVVVQLGEDKNGNYGLIISDSKGSVLLDSQGLHEGIVPDDFIKTDMIADGQITESKIDKTTMRDWTMPDGSKVFDVSHLWDGDDSFGKSYNTIKSTVSATSKELGDLSDKVDQLGNGYTVVLSNETQNIPCTSDGITATSFLIEIPFYGYEGIKQAVCTVTVGELPDGITLAENTAATSTAPGKITLNVAKGKTLGNKSLLTGTIVFTCIVSGKKISKKFTWIKSLAGKDGSQGIPAPTYYTWIRYADTPTSGISSDPTNKTYIGIAYNQTSQTPSSNYSDYQWSKFRGDDGASIKGDDGKTLYVWIKYADDAKGTNMSDAPEGKTYMGMAWNKSTSKESTNAADYSWSLIKGADGKDGKTPVKGVDYFDGVSSYVWIRYATDAKGTGMTAIPSTTTGYIGTATTTTAVAPTNASAYVWAKYIGEKGAKGDGGYIHIAYANSADGKTGFDTTIGTGKSYIGQYTDNIEDDSTNPSKYTWSLIKGADGKTLYTWLKYADSPTSGMSDSPAGKTYMGIAVNKTSITESSNYSDYTWSLIKGTDGISVKGDKGDTVYIWVKYADDAKGNGMSEYPDGKKYIGLAYNKTTATESNNASDYIWSLIQGEDAVLYEIEPSVAVIKKCTLDVCSITDESGNRIVDEQGRFLSAYFLTDSLSPNKITFTAYKQVGSKTRAIYACRFIIQESLNGLSWSTKYTSSEDETSVSYTPSTLKLQQIKCVMYRAGGITEQLDSQTVPVIQDAEGYDSVIQTFTDTFASVELKVDNNTKAITLKAEQKDITNAINNYDNTTVKDIRNRQTEQKVNIDGISTKVSDIETTINGSVDGTKTGLIEKVTQVTTKAGTIEANLKNNYTTTAGMNTQISNSIAASADKIKVTLADGKTESTLKAALGEIQKSVKDNAGNISTVTQKANSIETKVANQGNDIANLKVDAKAVETLVGSSAGTTDVVQKATDFRKTITDAAGNANLALSTANSNKNIISNMKVGAANTIRNSNDLIYDLYFMVASLRDESGNRIVAENGDYLVAYY
nr:MAG TPA: tail protein [Caudoviricetes sp.]